MQKWSPHRSVLYLSVLSMLPCRSTCILPNGMNLGLLSQGYTLANPMTLTSARLFCKNLSNVRTFQFNFQKVIYLPPGKKLPVRMPTLANAYNVARIIALTRCFNFQAMLTQLPTIEFVYVALFIFFLLQMLISFPDLASPSKDLGARLSKCSIS